MDAWIGLVDVAIARKPRVIPLSDAAIQIIRSLERNVGNPHLLPAHSVDNWTHEREFRKGKNPMSFPKKQ